MEGFVNVQTLTQQNDLQELIIAMKQMCLPTYPESGLVPGFHDHQYDDIEPPQRTDNPRELLGALDALQQVHDHHLQLLANDKLNPSKDCAVAFVLRHLTAVTRANLIDTAIRRLKSTPLPPQTSKGKCVICEQHVSGENNVCDDHKTLNDGLARIREKNHKHKTYIRQFIRESPQLSTLSVHQQLQALLQQLNQMLRTNNFAKLSPLINAASVCSQETNTSASLWLDDELLHTAQENVKRLIQTVKFLCAYVQGDTTSAADSLAENEKQKWISKLSSWRAEGMSDAERSESSAKRAKFSGPPLTSDADADANAEISDAEIADAEAASKLQLLLEGCDDWFFVYAHNRRKQNVMSFWTSIFGVDRLEEVIEQLDRVECKNIVHNSGEKDENWLMLVLEALGIDPIDRLLRVCDTLGVARFLDSELMVRMVRNKLCPSRQEYAKTDKFNNGFVNSFFTSDALWELGGVIDDVPRLLFPDEDDSSGHSFLLWKEYSKPYIKQLRDNELEEQMLKNLPGLKDYADLTTYAAYWRLNVPLRLHREYISPYIHTWLAKTLRTCSSSMPEKLDDYVSGRVGTNPLQLQDIRLNIFDPNMAVAQIADRSMVVHLGAEVLSLLLKEHPHLAVPQLRLDVVLDRTRNDFFPEFCFLVFTHHRLNSRYNGTRLTFATDNKSMVRSFRCTKLLFRHARVVTRTVSNELGSINLVYMLDDRVAARADSLPHVDESALRTHPCHICNTSHLWRQVANQ